MITWPLTPFLRSGMVWRILFLLCLVYSIFHYTKSQGKLPKLTCGAFLFILLLWCYNLLLGMPHFVYVRSISITMFCACTIIFDWSLITRYREQNIRILKWVFLYLSIWNYSSFYDYLIVPGLTRDMTSGQIQNIEELSGLSQNTVLFKFCVDFSQLYAQTLLFPISIYLTRTRLISREIGYIYILSVLLLIFNAGFSTAIICLSIGIIGSFIYKTSTKSFCGLLLLIFSFVFFIRQTLGNLLLDWVTDPFIRYKLEYFFGDQSNTSYNFDRTELWKISMDSFFNSPFIGDGEVGGHSGILDFFATYGIVLGFLFIALLYTPLGILYNKFKCDYQRNILLTFTLIFSICIVFNPVQFSYGVVLLGVLPLLFIKTQPT